MGYRKVDVNPFNSILSILFLVAVFVGLYYLATSVFTILSWLAPVLLIGALIIDHRVVINYGKWLLNTLKTNLPLGIGAVVLMIFGYPVIAGYLFTKAIVSKKLQSVKADFEERTRPQFADYEEVDDPEEVAFEDLSNEKPLDLNAPKPSQPPAPKAPPGDSARDSDYNQFFE